MRRSKYFLLNFKTGHGVSNHDMNRFIQVVDLYEPVSDGTKDKVFISRSYDATTHFETSTGKIMHLV